jgi:branched-chain amino acid aminotransferase
MPLICYVNGEFVSAEQAAVSAFDHGFLYGDGIFESLTVSDGRIFKLGEHLDRLERSARALRLALPENRDRLAEIVKEAVRRSGVRDVYVRIVVSRGAGYPLLDPRVTTGPSLVVLLHLPAPPAETGTSYRARGAGLRLKTAAVRKVPAEAFEPRVKSLNYLNNVLARIEAIESGYDEAILLDMRGFVAEAAGENIFVVSAGKLKTPRAQQVLDGITRRTVLDLARRAEVASEETDLTLYDLYTADECFLTSSFSRIHAVAEVDGRPVPAPGPITRQLRQQILELERSEGELILGGGTP